MLLGQLVGGVEQPVEIVADGQVALLSGHLGQRFQRLVEAFAQHRHVDPGLGQQRARAAALLVQQRGEYMHRFDDVVVAAHGQRLGVSQRLLETRGELVHPHGEFLFHVMASVAGRCNGYAVVAQ
ncbi:hypothetical protein D3C71_1468930 [compost metagenome]